MEFQSLRLEIEAGLARIVLARPAAANRVDARLLREIEAAAERVSDDASVAVCLVTAEGPDFCAGWDPETREQLLTREPQIVDPFLPLAGLACPVIVAVQGRALSAGLELALACDVRLAAEDARFGLPEVGEGLLPLAGGTQRLARLAGRAVASAVLLLGEELDAEAAYRCGLVSRIVPASGLASEASAVAARAASRGPLALRYAKEAVRHGLALPLDEALRYELDLSIILQTTRDRAEGVRAFLEKREPRFEGE
jgi:enoyl-CoA hydratase/carnithine racemase